jgi:hypothetical protein
MICSSLCRVPSRCSPSWAQHVTSALLASVTSLVRENSHSRLVQFLGAGSVLYWDVHTSVYRCADSIFGIDVLS